MKAHILRAAAVLLLALSAAWGGYAALADAPVEDEEPHLAAGISYVELADYRLNPEHPPLAKLAAGVLAQLASPELPTREDWWAGGINEQWRAGRAVLWELGNDPAAVLGLGRAGVLLLNLALLALGWRAIARRYGEGVAAGFVALVAASPFFLGHAHLVTTDVTAAGMALASCFTFASFLRSPSWRTGAVAALVFGAAQLAKFSLVLLIPAFLVAAALPALQRSRRDWRGVLRAVAKPAAVMAAGFALVVYPAYAALTLRAPNGVLERDARFLLGSFAGGPPQGFLCWPVRCLAEATILASQSRVTAPAAQYALGVLMVMQRSAGGNTVYFAGEVGAAGSRLYFPYVYLGKETFAALAILALGAGYGAWRARGRWREVGREHSLELVAGTFAVLYVLMTLRSSLNIGVRHLFPVIPVAYLGALRAWQAAGERARYAGYALAGLLAAHVALGAASLPHPLAYYNAAGGGEEGYRIATDSNFDWGQDVLRLRAWMDAHPEAGRVAVDLFGGSDVREVLGGRAVPWHSAKGSPAAYGIRWVAISATPLMGATGVPVPREPRLVQDEYRWLRAARGTPAFQVPAPDARAGASIFLYELE